MTPNLFDQTKSYEDRTDTTLMPGLPAFARLDGRCFSTFTRHAKKPFSTTFKDCMLSLTQDLIETTGADLGYTVSDEITLCWTGVKYLERDSWFGGRVQKIVSTLAATASAKFNYLGLTDMEKRTSRIGVQDLSGIYHSGLEWWRLPTFDCRVWNVPNLDEATNVFLCRQNGAIKNSVRTVARTVYSHMQLLSLSTAEVKNKLLYEHGINWADYDSHFRHGTFIFRRVVKQPFMLDELPNLLEKHNARKDPTITFDRTFYPRINLSLVDSVNPRDVLFNQASVLPETAEKSEVPEVPVKTDVPETAEKSEVPEVPVKTVLPELAVKTPEKSEICTSVKRCSTGTALDLLLDKMEDAAVVRSYIEELETLLQRAKVELACSKKQTVIKEKI